jgi:hypothetical protein
MHSNLTAHACYKTNVNHLKLKCHRYLGRFLHPKSGHEFILFNRVIYYYIMCIMYASKQFNAAINRGIINGNNFLETNYTLRTVTEDTFQTFC